MVRNSDQAQKFINKRNFKSYKIFGDNLIACHIEKITVKYGKPIYVGMGILDMCKNLMHDFYYNHIKKKYKIKPNSYLQLPIHYIITSRLKTII